VRVQERMVLSGERVGHSDGCYIGTIG
jgi:hypothetical protein